MDHTKHHHASLANHARFARKWLSSRSGDVKRNARREARRNARMIVREHLEALS